jgi:hypothetical protein
MIVESGSTRIFRRHHPITHPALYKALHRIDEPQVIPAKHVAQNLGRCYDRRHSQKPTNVVVWSWFFIAQLSLIHVKNAVPFANTRDTNVRQVALIVSSELALQFERLAHNPCLSEFPNTSLTRLFYLARKKLVCSPIVCVHLRDPKVIRRRSPNVDCLVLHRTRDSAIYCKGFNRR